MTSRPTGNNADEWHLFLCERLDNRAARPNGLTYCAVQIAEALDAAEAKHASALTAAETRIAGLEAALRHYGRHDGQCDALGWGEEFGLHLKDDGVACDCGFIAGLDPKP